MAKTRIKTCFVFVLKSTFSLLILAGGLGACANRPCREPRLPELDRAGGVANKSVTTPAVSSGAENSGVANASSAEGERRVRIFKADGSRQCEPNPPGLKSVSVMERELAGIKVFSRERRKDGLMHIQVCGGPTGMINLYEIDQGQLKQAEERGFKKWEE